MAITSTFTFSMSAGDGLQGDSNFGKTAANTFLGIMQSAIQAQTIGVAAPAAPTCTPGTGGSMAAGAYLVKITYVNAPQGESLPSTESSSQAVSASGTLTVNSPAASSPATGYNVYITAANGAAGTETKQNSTPIPIGTNYVQSAAVASGAALPVTNTTLIFALTLPSIPVQGAYIKNLAVGSTQTAALSWTTQGGSSNKVLDLQPGAMIAFQEPSAGSGQGGITAATLVVAQPQTPIEAMFIA